MPDDELVPVHRMYVTPETWDTPRSERVEDEIEVWCLSCTSQYPHRVVEDAEEGD